MLSICEWGTAKPWLWGKEVGGNLWRTTGDIQDRFSGKKEWEPGNCCNFGVTAILDAEDEIYSYAGPGHWNDPDMLEVGNGGMSAEVIALATPHFALTGRDGSFQIPNVPAGVYRMEIWHELATQAELNSLSHEVEITAGDNALATMTIHASAGHDDHKNKYGEAYTPDKTNKY